MIWRQIVFTEIHVFDFDGTLFKSPEYTVDNQKKYELETGIPWLITKEKAAELTEKMGRPVFERSGWWGRHETLEPPLVPNPVTMEWFNPQVLSEFNTSKKSNHAITLLLTGRHFHLRKHVERICNDVGIIDDDVHLFLMGENGPKPEGAKPTNTFSWKSWIIDQFIKLNPEVNKLIIWEDRLEHIEKFKGLQKSLEKEFIINYIKST